jgi:hypothetical protein
MITMRSNTHTWVLYNRALLPTPEHLRQFRHLSLWYSVPDDEAAVAEHFAASPSPEANWLRWLPEPMMFAA